MKIEQIQQVLEIFKTGSFSQAARNLYLSQPNLSHSIKQLEIELGHILFERTTMGIIPTEFGKEFLSYAATLQRQYDDFLFYCTSFRPKKTLSLRFAMCLTQGYRISIFHQRIMCPTSLLFLRYYQSWRRLLTELGDTYLHW